MMRARRRLPGSLFLVCALTCSVGLPACWVVVGGEDKVLVELEEGRGGRTGKAPTQGGGAGAQGGEGGSGDPAGGTSGGSTIGGAAGTGGASGASVGGAGGADGGAGAVGGASGATSGTGGGGTTAGGNGGTSVGGAGAGAGGLGGAGGAGGGAGAGGSAGKAGASGTGGASGGGGKAGASGAAGAGGGVQTGPGQFDCKAEPAKSSYPFCTNFSPAPGDWETFTGCNTRPVEAGNTTLLWSAAAGSKCTAFLKAGVPVSPTQATLSLWVRAVEIGVAASEPGLDFARLDLGTHPGGSIGLRQVRNGLGVITENIVVVRSPALPAGMIDLGPMSLDKWHHVSVTVGFKGGNATVGGGYGLTSADELKTDVRDTTTAAATAPLKLQLSFIQTEFLAGKTSVEIDDAYVH